MSTSRKDVKREKALDACGFEFFLSGVPDGAEATLHVVEQQESGLADIAFRLTSTTAVRPTPIEISWRVPVCGIHFKWNPVCMRHRMLDVMNNCNNQFESRAVSGAPVVSLYGMSGTNELTFALSDAMHETEPFVSLTEDGYIACGIRLFREPWDPITEYTAVLRLDQRQVPYSAALGDVATWWSNLCTPREAPIPDAARRPFYSTWYSYHGAVTQADVERECRLAAPLGMKGMLVDAGWGVHGGIDEEKFPDIAALCGHAHRLDMKLMLWTNLLATSDVQPKEVREKARVIHEGRNTRRLDARYPVVRDYIVNAYCEVLKQFDVDGFKIDFVEQAGRGGEDEPDDPERDFKSVPEAVDCCLEAVYKALRAIKPDVMIEFRQRYNGPHMLRHCTMMRAVDCGNSFADNRMRVLDIRLLCGSTPVHADMMIWHPDEPVESAAMQLVHTLFAVPQVSVRLDKIPSVHVSMIRTYLSFWSSHREVLLDGALTPFEPEAFFPLVISRTDRELLAAVYADRVVPLPTDVPECVTLVNGTYEDRVVLECDQDIGEASIIVTTCTGETAWRGSISLEKGLNRIDIPPAGYAELRIPSVG